MINYYNTVTFRQIRLRLIRFSICLAIMGVALSAVLEVRAQTVVINTGTAGTPEYAVGPVYMSPTLFYRASRYAYLYTQAEMAAAGITTGSSITVVGWMKNNSASSLIAGNLRIYMKNSSATAYSNATETWTNLNAGTTLVYQNLSQSIPATASPSYIPFTLTTPFPYTGGALEISVEWDATGSTGTLASGSFDWVWSTVTDRIYGNGGTTLSNSLSSTSNNTTINDRRPFIQITYTSGVPVTCAAPTVPNATGMTATSAILNWTQTGTPAQWQIKYGPAGFNVNTGGTSIFTPTKPYTLNPPLSPATAYDYYVRAVCGANDTSLWSPVTSFTTLTVPITCAAPTAPTATGVTATTASLNWTQTGTPAQWQIKYGPPGFNVSTAGTSVFTTTKPYTLNPPLTPTTTYDYYVRAVCGANDTSLWTPVANFTTACVAPTIVSKTDSFNCGTGAVVLKATASTGGSIKWYAALTGGTALFTGNVYTTPSLTATTTYYIAAAAGTCESTPRQAVVASIRPIPVVNIGNDTTICPGITYTMNAGNAGATYLWNTNATTQSITAGTAGNYSVLVTLNGCSGSDARVITAGVVPQNNLAVTTDLCEGETATLNAGNSGSSFSWTPGGATTQTVNVTTGGTKSVTIKSTAGCVITSNTNVIMRPLPVIDLGNDTSICEGASITLDAGNPSDNHLWSTGATAQTIIASDSGTYGVTVTTSYNCESSDEKHIAYLASPRVNGFNFIPLFYEELGKVKFTALDPTSVTSYLWNFGDGSPTSSLISPTHTYPASGIYTASLKVFNGCSEYETSLTINVDKITGLVTLDKNEANVVVYPNPSGGLLTIDNRSVAVKLQSLIVFNTLGAVVYRGSFTGNRHQVQTGQLASGMYSIRILTDKGYVVRKFEVRH